MLKDKAKKVALSFARHKTDNTGCCICNSENGHSKSYMQEVARLCKEQGIDCIISDQADDHGTLRPFLRRATAFGASILYVRHTNAGGDGTARGQRVLCHPNSAKLAQELCNVRQPLLDSLGYKGDKSKIVTNTNLIEIMESTMPCIYDELFFHNNCEDMKFSHKYEHELAKNTVQYFCKMFGMEYKDTDTPKPIEPEVPTYSEFVLKGKFTSKKVIYSSASNANSKTSPLSLQSSYQDKELVADEIYYSGNVARHGNIGFFNASEVEFGNTAPTPPSIKENPYKEPTKNISNGSRGEDVKWVQWELKEKGYDIGRAGIDGICGRDTVTAIKAFQKASNIAVDGICGVSTRKAFKGEAVAPSKPNLEQVARDVINGKYGNGAERKKRLEQAGYNAKEVQKKVNDILK